MSTEPEWQAHVYCVICQEPRYRGDVKEVDGRYVCVKGDCRNDYDQKTAPGILTNRTNLAKS